MYKNDKNMKHHSFLIFKLFSFSVLAVLLTGCSESFLEQEPQKQASLDDYFSTQEHILEAVNSIYSPAHVYDYYVDTDNKGMYGPVYFSDVMGDDMLVGAAGPTDQEVWHLAANYSSNELNTPWSLWDVSYNGIRFANEAISYAEKNASKLPAEFVNRVKAEAGVMRAFYYTIVWKFFGNIPYFTEVLYATSKVTQLPADQAYQSIIGDLEAAIALNALPMKQNDDNLGRATKAMAYMVYAELVMYQNDESRFSKALDYMKEIINDPDYDLNPSYPAIWTPEGEWSKESIFEVNFTDGPVCGRAYPDAGDPYKTANYVIGGTIAPRVLAPQGGVAADGIEDGWGTFIVRKTTYDLFANNDTRRDASCYKAPEGGYTPRYQDQGIFCGKYVGRSSHKAPDTGGAGDMGFNDNWRVYRYAETLLNAAELLVRTNGDLTVAKGYITKVRQRAGLVSEVDATLDNILQERRLEFVGEGKRYWDLVRMEPVSGVNTKASTALKAEQEPINAAGDYGRTNSWTPRKKYLPIYFKEINAAEGGLKQNAY